MPNDRFIAREDDVLDLETGIRYSTADDAEAVADLLNTTPPQPVSGGADDCAEVLAAERVGIADQIRSMLLRADMPGGTEGTALEMLATEMNGLERGLRANPAAALKSSPSLEGSGAVVIDAEVRHEMAEMDDCGYAELAPAFTWVRVNDDENMIVLPADFPTGPVRLSITPIPKKGAGA